MIPIDLKDVMRVMHDFGRRPMFHHGVMHVLGSMASIHRHWSRRSPLLMRLNISGTKALFSRPTGRSLSRLPNLLPDDRAQRSVRI